MTDVRATAVDIPTEDGVADAYLVHPADDRPRPAVLFYQDAYGPRPYLRSMADRLAGAGYTVLLPNVFHRLGRAPVLDLPEFIDPGADPTLWERLGPIVSGLTPEQVKRDADAYLRWLADSPLTVAGPVALTGYCMGPGSRCGPRAPTRTGSRRRPASTAGDWPPTTRTARTWRPRASPRSCTSGTRTTTPRCPRSRSRASRTP